jgi:hypothetical protein
MIEEDVRINRLNDPDSNNGFTRDWYIEIDQPVSNEVAESNKYSFNSLLPKINATNSKYGTIIIGTEGTVRQDTAPDYENVLSASMLRLLFNRTYDINNNDIFHDNTNSLYITQWDIASIGNMLWHAGMFNCNVGSSKPRFLFKNLGDLPPYGMPYSPNVVDLVNNVVVSAVMKKFIDVDEKEYLILELDITKETTTNINFSINGWYFRDRGEE